MTLPRLLNLLLASILGFYTGVIVNTCEFPTIPTTDIPAPPGAVLTCPGLIICRPSGECFCRPDVKPDTDGSQDQ